MEIFKDVEKNNKIVKQDESYLKTKRKTIYT